MNSSLPASAVLRSSEQDDRSQIFKSYLKQTGKLKPVSEETENEWIRSGNIEKLFAYHYPIILEKAHEKSQQTGEDVQDVVQFLLAHLLEEFANYSWKKTFSFWVKSQIRKAFAEREELAQTDSEKFRQKGDIFDYGTKTELGKDELDSYALTKSEISDPEAIFMKQEMANAVQNAIDGLKIHPRDKKVIKIRYGIGLNQTYTDKEIGEMCHVTGCRIQQIEQQALRILHHRTSERNLADLDPISDTDFEASFDFRIRQLLKSPFSMLSDNANELIMNALKRGRVDLQDLAKLFAKFPSLSRNNAAIRYAEETLRKKIKKESVFELRYMSVEDIASVILLLFSVPELANDREFSNLSYLHLQNILKGWNFSTIALFLRENQQFLHGESVIHTLHCRMQEHFEKKRIESEEVPAILAIFQTVPVLMRDEELCLGFMKSVLRSDEPVSNLKMIFQRLPRFFKITGAMPLVRDENGSIFKLLRFFPELQKDRDIINIYNNVEESTV